MQKKCLKIMVFALFISACAIGVSLSMRQKTNWDTLMKENVEALTSSETDNPHYPCVPAAGFCIIDGIDKDGIAIVREK